MSGEMTPLERHLKHERLYVTLMIAGLLFINNSINATSILMEAQRSGASIPLSRTFITEYSSVLALLALVPAILWFTRRFPLGWETIRRNGLGHLGFSVLFSIAHFGLFVALRKFLFGLQRVDYSSPTTPW